MIFSYYHLILKAAFLKHKSPGTNHESFLLRHRSLSPNQRVAWGLVTDQKYPSLYFFRNFRKLTGGDREKNKHGKTTASFDLALKETTQLS